MPESKARKGNAARTFEAPLDVSFNFQLVKQKADHPEANSEGADGSLQEGLTVNLPEPKIVSRLIDRIQKL